MDATASTAAVTARKTAAKGAGTGASLVAAAPAAAETLGPVAGKWSARRTLIVIVASCGVFWGGVVAALQLLG